MTDRAELLPCPFCGGESEIERRGTTRQSNIVACTECGCRLESGDTFNPALSWNTRTASPAADREEVARQDDDEAYEIGKRDGYEEALQELDLATGGDGEFKGSTVPGETVDVPEMKARIMSRFIAPSVTTPTGEADASAAHEDVLDSCRKRLSTLREQHRQKMNSFGDAAEKAASEGDMSAVSINSTESERHREAFSALNAAIDIFDTLYNDPQSSELPRWHELAEYWKDRAEKAEASTTPAPGAVAEPVKVKPLEWQDHQPNSFPYPEWSAQTPFGIYSIEAVSASDSPRYEVRLNASRLIADRDGLPEAKEAAQSDYEQRIRSALVNQATIDAKAEPSTPLADRLHTIGLLMRDDSSYQRETIFEAEEALRKLPAPASDGAIREAAWQVAAKECEDHALAGAPDDTSEEYDQGYADGCNRCAELIRALWYQVEDRELATALAVHPPATEKKEG